MRDAAGSTPLLVKIAPDLTDDEVTRIARLAVDLGLAGIIATNTTISRDGLSTDPAVVAAAARAGSRVRRSRRGRWRCCASCAPRCPAGFCVISVGGVETAADVRERLDAGATLVQGYTAFLYRGPLWARQINRGLAGSGVARTAR